MRIQRYSRRRDLLVGALGSTLLVCSAVWLSQGTRVAAATTTKIVGPLGDPPLPPIEVDPKPLEDDVAPAVKARQPAPPDIIDIVRPAAPDQLTQPVEPPRPIVDSDPNARIVPLNPSVGPEIFKNSELDQQAVAKFQAKPQYPYAMKSEGFSGTVVVDFIVDPSGNVRNVSAVSSTRSEFESAAIAAVSRWKFYPGKKGGRRVYTHMQVPIEFSIDSSSP